jgi:3-hydroxy-9,10-secoandrosta-1,3,5(10)-triene-9,17-dione monooxygenase
VSVAEQPAASGTEAPTDLVAAVEAITPQLAAARAEGEALRRLPDHVWGLLLGCGILRALQPRRWGGGEVHLREFHDAVMAVSRVNPSAGWVAGVIGVHPWQLALFDEQAQRDLWGDDPTTMHSSSYMPTGRATPVDGGYELAGRWSFSSGCDLCRGVILGAAIPGGEITDFRSFLLLPDQYRIDDNWHVAGLKGTGSKDIVVDGTFVPSHRTQSHLDYAFAAPLPGRALNDGPLYRLPFSVVFNMALAASILGSAGGFVDTWTAESRDRSVAGVGRVADDPLTQRRLAEARWDLDAATAMMRADVDELWEMAKSGATPTMADRARMRWHLTRGCERVSDSVLDLLRAGSGRSVFLDHPLQSRYQDLQAGLSHAYLAPDQVARAVGGELLGTSKPPFVL